MQTTTASPRLSNVYRILFLTLASAPWCPAPCFGGVTIEDIVKAWQAREKRYATAEYTWTSEDVELNKSMEGVEGLHDYTTDTRTYYAALSGGKWVHRRSGRFWDAGHDFHKFLPTSYTSQFDGITSRTLFDRREYQQDCYGVIQAGYAQSEIEGNQHLMGLALAFRPLSPQLGGVTPRDWRVLPVEASSGGARCVVLERPRGASHEQLLVDPEREFVPVEIRRFLGERLYMTVTIAYTRDARHGVVPTSWGHVEHMPNTLLSKRDGLYSRGRATVTSYVINGDLDEELFATIKWPPGTRLYDEQKNAFGVVRPNGSVRPVTRGELARNATVAQLLSTEPGLAGLPAPYFGTGSRVAIGIGAAVGVGCFALYLGRRRVRVPPPVT